MSRPCRWRLRQTTWSVSFGTWRRCPSLRCATLGRGSHRTLELAMAGHDRWNHGGCLGWKTRLDMLLENQRGEWDFWWLFFFDHRLSTEALSESFGVCRHGFVIPVLWGHVLCRFWFQVFLSLADNPVPKGAWQQHGRKMTNKTKQWHKTTTQRYHRSYTGKVVFSLANAESGWRCSRLSQAGHCNGCNGTPVAW